MMDLLKAINDGDVDALASGIEQAFVQAVRAAVERHVADGTIAVLGPAPENGEPVPTSPSRG